MVPAHRDEEAAAVTEFRDLAAGRLDLLVEDTSEGELDEPLAQQAPTRRRPRWAGGRAAAGRSRPHETAQRPASGGPRLLCGTGARLRAAPRSLPPCPVTSPLRSPQ